MNRIQSSWSVRKARQHHNYLRRKNPRLARAIPRTGMVLPGGAVAFALADGGTAVYGVAAPVTGWRCWSLRAHGPVIETALIGLADFDRCVRAAAHLDSESSTQIAAK